MNINENFSNEIKILEKLRDAHIKLPMFHLPCVLVYQTLYQLNVRHCTFTIRYNMKSIYYEYS